MTEDRSILEGIGEVGPGEEVFPGGENNIPEKEKVSFDMGFLTTKTGEGSIADYQDHPLNYNKSKGMAQIIRGFTGLFGALDLAIIDILVGALQISKEKKVGEALAH